VARIRTIKPEFWTHEDLSALPEATHMLAAALLNHADDEGYFNANPGLVKAACCPLREPSVSVQDSIISLVSAGYLRIGSASDGKRYGQVVSFDNHQRVNRPTPSKIKALQIVWDGSLQPHAQITATSSPERNREQGKEGKGEEPKGSLSPAAVGDCPHESIIALYHETLPSLRQVQTWEGERPKLLRTRWREADERRDLAWWREFFGYVAGSDFLMGRTTGVDGRSFDCDLEWLIRPKNFAKVIEGKYENRRAQ
jgi:hypothetical protein